MSTGDMTVRVVLDVELECPPELSVRIVTTKKLAIYEAKTSKNHQRNKTLMKKHLPYFTVSLHPTT